MEYFILPRSRKSHFTGPTLLRAATACTLALLPLGALHLRPTRADSYPPSGGWIGRPADASDSSVAGRSGEEMDGRVGGVAIGKRVVLIARPLDSNFTVSSVRFILDGKMLAECGAPGRWVWNTDGQRAGRHVVQVQAFAGDQLIGLSEPLVIYLGNSDATEAAAPQLEVPFFTYQFDRRRGNTIVAPKIKSNSAQFAETAATLSSRLPNPLVEVYLNGVRQEFAPAARVASADELAGSPAGTSGRVAALGSAPVARSRRYRHRHQSGSLYASRVGLPPRETNRTVWIPARPLLERLGAQVEWQPRERTLVADLSIAGAPRRIVLTLAGHPAGHAEIQGQRVALQTPIRLADNAIMVPLSFCEDALALRVMWKKANHRVEMFTPIAPV